MKFTICFLGVFLALSASVFAGGNREAEEARETAAAGGAEEAYYPIAIEHALGTTVISEKPERIAAVSWANHEVPLALGVVPVGFASVSWGDEDGDGLHSWVSERLDELGAEVPVLFDEGDGIDFEAVAATNPDVILAAYSGLSQEDYDLLSEIAPVAAYPEAAWATNWRDTIMMNSIAMGLASEGEELIRRMEAKIKTTVAAYPQIVGRGAMFINHIDATDLSTVNFYAASDQRVQFLEDLGMVTPRSVREASREGAFSGSVSAERIDQFDDVDIIITYEGQEVIDAMNADPLISRMPAVKAGAVVAFQNNGLGTSPNPLPLGVLSWVLEAYVATLAEAVDKLSAVN